MPLINHPNNILSLQLPQRDVLEWTLPHPTMAFRHAWALSLVSLLQSNSGVLLLLLVEFPPRESSSSLDCLLAKLLNFTIGDRRSTLGDIQRASRYSRFAAAILMRLVEKRSIMEVNDNVSPIKCC